MATGNALREFSPVPNARARRWQEIAIIHQLLPPSSMPQTSETAENQNAPVLINSLLYYRHTGQRASVGYGPSTGCHAISWLIVLRVAAVSFSRWWPLLDNGKHVGYLWLWESIRIGHFYSLRNEGFFYRRKVVYLSVLETKAIINSYRFNIALFCKNLWRSKIT